MGYHLFLKQSTFKTMFKQKLQGFKMEMWSAFLQNFMHFDQLVNKQSLVPVGVTLYAVDT